MIARTRTRQAPTEYIQIKGRGTRRFTFLIGNTEYEKRHFFLLDFCAVAEFFEEKYDYAAPLKLPARDARRTAPTHRDPREEGGTVREPGRDSADADAAGLARREIPVWEGTDRIVSQQVPAYAELDAKLTWQPTANLGLSVVGQNLLHRRHAEFGASAARREFQRGVYGALEWRF